MYTIRKSVSAICAMVLVAATSAQAQETAPPAEAPVPPVTAPATQPAVDADGFQKPIVTLDLPDGRKAMIFANKDNLPPLPEGYIRDDAANGRVGYLSAPGPRTLIPNRVKGFIAADAPYTVVASTRVSGRDTLIEIPYHHSRVFRLTSDHTSKMPIFHKEITFAKAGSMGFYAGMFNGGILGSRTMFCYFPAADVIKYDAPSCGLGLAGHTEINFQPVATTGNLPVFYTVTTMYGTPITNYVEGFKSEMTTDRIPHDFKLLLRFIKRTSKGVVVDWVSEGSNVDEEVVPLNTNGQAVIDFAEGRLTLTPDAKDKKAATFAWAPKENIAPKP